MRLLNMEPTDPLSNREDRVKANVAGRTGKLVVEFGSLSDLDQIPELMAPGEHVCSSQ